MTELIRVLIAGDDLFAQESLTTLIDASNDLTCVGQVSTENEAAEFIDEGGVDVVILDADTPGMQGLEISRRALAQHPDVRILMLTSHECGHVVDDAVQLGVSGLLQKKTTRATVILDTVRMVHTGMIVFSPEPMEALRCHQHAEPALHGDLPELSTREAEVLNAVCGGLTNTEAAHQLYLSESSIKAYVTSLMRKFNVSTRVKLLLKARRLGFHQFTSSE